MSTSIFLTGATGIGPDPAVESALTRSTGYIGGSVLAQLLEHRLVKTFEITVLVRSPDKGELLRSMGLKTLFGSNSDHELLITAASAADVVFACVRLVSISHSTRTHT